MVVFMSICIFLLSLNSINIFYIVGKTNIGDMDIIVMPNSNFGVMSQNISTKHRVPVSHHYNTSSSSNSSAADQQKMMDDELDKLQYHRYIEDTARNLYSLDPFTYPPKNASAPAPPQKKKKLLSNDDLLDRANRKARGERVKPLHIDDGDVDHKNHQKHAAFSVPMVNVTELEAYLN